MNDEGVTSGGTNDEGKTPDAGKTPDDGGKPAKSFTQDDVNAIVRREIERERAKIGDLDDLKRKAGEFDKLTDAQKSEAQKFAEKTSSLERDVADRDRTIQEMRIQGSVATAAAKLNFHDPDDAWKLIDLANVDFDADGAAKNVDKVLEALAKAKPHLVRNGGRPGSFDGGSRTPAADEDMNTKIRRAAGRTT